MRRLAFALAALALLPAALRAEPAAEPRPRRVLPFLAGGAAAFLFHEGGHVAADLILGAEPRLERVSYGFIPFVAITHSSEVSRRERFAIASAGFWMQFAASEWALAGEAPLRARRAPFRKGVLTFHVLTSAGYAATAFARSGPLQRDTRGMALGLEVGERWVGAMVLLPAALDAVRYYRPQSAWARWGARAAKAGLVLLVLR